MQVAGPVPSSPPPYAGRVGLLFTCRLVALSLTHSPVRAPAAGEQSRRKRGRPAQPHCCQVRGPDCSRLVRVRQGGRPRAASPTCAALCNEARRCPPPTSDTPAGVRSRSGGGGQPVPQGGPPPLVGLLCMCLWLRTPGGRLAPSSCDACRCSGSIRRSGSDYNKDGMCPMCASTSLCGMS